MDVESSYFVLLPIDVWREIAAKLSTFQAVHNLCLAYPPFCDHLQRALEVANHREAIGHLLEQNGVNPKTCRLVSKDWKKSVDDCMNAERVDLSVSAKKSRRRLVPTIYWPLRQDDVARLSKLAQAGTDRFSRNALQVRIITHCSDWPSLIKDAKEIARIAESFQEIWKRIKHLEIYYNGRDGILYHCPRQEHCCKPILQYMENVKRVIVSDTYCGTFVLSLPNLKMVEELVCVEPEDYCESNSSCMDVGWDRVLGACQSHLRLLHIRMVEPWYLKRLQFPCLEEFAMCLGFPSDCMIPNVDAARAIPNVSTLSVVCTMNKWLYAKDLIDRLAQLSCVHICTLGHYGRPYFPWLPFRRCGIASDTVKYVKLEGGKDETMQLAPLFPNAKHELVVSLAKTPRGNLDLELENDKLEDLKVDGELNPQVVAKVLGRRLTFEELQILPDIICIARGVSSCGVLKTDSLWQYLGGPHRITMERFVVLGELVSERVFGLQVQGSQQTEDVGKTMGMVQKRFGSGFFHGIDYEQEFLLEHEWLDIVSKALPSDLPKGPFDGCQWEVVLSSFKIRTVESGDQLLRHQFYQKVIPLLSQGTNDCEFRMHGRVDLEPTSRNAMIVIFYTIQKLCEPQKVGRGRVTRRKPRLESDIELMLVHRGWIRRHDTKELVKMFKDHCKKDDANDYFGTTREDMIKFRKCIGLK